MKNVFLNYRREDSAGSAGRIFDLLSNRLQGMKIFMDVDAIEPGADFARVLDEQLAGCDYFIAIVGPNWINAHAADGRRRLDDAKDYLRVEIEAALKRGIRVVPVLVDGAKMPQPDEVPDSLRPFCTRNALTVAHNRFASDIDNLATAIKQNLGIETRTGSPDEPGRSPSSWPEVLVSFQGRLSRKAYWVWNLLVIFPITILLQHLLLLVAGGSIAEFITTKPSAVSVQLHLIMLIATLPISWCAFAITAKRLHDFNAGWGFLATLFVLTLILGVVTVADSAIQANLSSSTIEAGEAGLTGLMDGFAFGYSILYFAIWVAIGCVPSTPGQNRYGPDTRRQHGGAKAGRA